MTCTITKTLTYLEETDLLAMAYTAVAMMRNYAAESINNKEYWMNRAEEFTKVADKLNAEMRQVVENV